MQSRPLYLLEKVSNACSIKLFTGQVRCNICSTLTKRFAESMAIEDTPGYDHPIDEVGILLMSAGFKPWQLRLLAELFMLNCYCLKLDTLDSHHSTVLYVWSRSVPDLLRCMSDAVLDCVVDEDLINQTVGMLLGNMTEACPGACDIDSGYNCTFYYYLRTVRMILEQGNCQRIDK